MTVIIGKGQFVPLTNLSPVFIMNLPPVFITPIGGPFEFEWGMPWMPSYQLPETLDPEGKAVTVTVNSGAASSFLTYNAATNTFVMTETSVANIGNHSISVVLTDADGKFSNYAFQLTITKNNKANSTMITTTSNTAEEFSSDSSVLSVLEAETLLATVECTINDAGVIYCTSNDGFSYNMNAETGKLLRKDRSKASASSKAAKKSAKPPRLSISKVSS